MEGWPDDFGRASLKGSGGGALRAAMLLLLLLLLLLLASPAIIFLKSTLTAPCMPITHLHQ